MNFYILFTQKGFEILQRVFMISAVKKTKTLEELFMKKNKMKMALALTTALTMMTAVTGCGAKEQETATTTTTTTTTEQAVAETPAATTEEAATTETKELTGSISMSGSTSMEKLANAMAESFMEKYSGVTVTAEFTGSSAGIEAVQAGSVDIGNASRALKDTELEAGVVENVVAIDGIAVVGDKNNNVSDLSQEQLADIYTGSITNWSEVGGNDEAIVVVGREAGSGTRDGFEELLSIKDSCAYANELDSTGAVMAKVASTEGAIGYVSLDVVDDSVKAFSINGVEPTAENIKADTYLLKRPFVMATKGEISEQNELVQEFFAYLASEEGKAVVKGVGLITVD